MRKRGLPYPVTAKQAWLILFGLVVLHEIAAKPGELLSEEVDRQLIQRRWLTIGFGAVTAAHLYNLIPPKVDPYNWLAVWASR